MTTTKQEFLVDEEYYGCGSLSLSGGTQGDREPATKMRLHIELVHLVKIFRVQTVAFAGLVCHATEQDRAVLVGDHAEARPRLRRHAGFLHSFPLHLISADQDLLHAIRGDLIMQFEELAR